MEFSQEVLQKIAAMRSNGASQLHIIADFDRTLTKPIVDGKSIPSTIAQVRAGGYLGKEYSDKSYALFDIYHPIEIDPSVPREEKHAKMTEWWSKHLSLLVEYGMNKNVIGQVCSNMDLHLREGVSDFIETLHNQHVPMLIFSAGSGDVIEGVLENEGKLYENIHVVSNFLDFDSDGYATGYKSNIIHVLNKGEVAIKDTPYAKEVVERKNVLLLGDSETDPEMADGLEHDTILKIGFLNKNYDEQLARYQELYDIVLPDSSFDVVNDVLGKILDE